MACLSNDGDILSRLAIKGETGQYVTIVRQAGHHYYLGSITNHEPRTLQVPLQFLNGIPQPLSSIPLQHVVSKRDKQLSQHPSKNKNQKGDNSTSQTVKRYQAIIYADAPDTHYQTNPQAYQIMQQIVTPNDTLTIHLAPGGGQAIIFIPIEWTNRKDITFENYVL